ncbi:MAG: glycosyltransferase family 4 protein, partial [Gemmatimonadaceae bacterium]
QCYVAARPLAPLAERAHALGLPVVPAAPTGEAALLTAWRLRRFIKRHDVQIVHAQTAHDVTLGAMCTLGTTARLVVTRHLAKPPRANPGTRWKYGRAAAVMAVSRAAADALGAAGVRPELLSVVHGGVETDRTVEPAPAELLATLGVPPGAPLAVMVGALVEQKDPLTFVRAVAAARREAPTVHGLLVGEGELRGAVETEIAGLGLSEFVHLAGFRTDVDELLAAARVAVLSSRFEGLPLVIMDAFALGVPVAATAGSGTPELVTDNDTGLLVPVGDAHALGAAIARIVNDPALARRLRQAGLARADDFSVRRMADATVAVYRDVLRGAR